MEDSDDDDMDDTEDESDDDDDDEDDNDDDEDDDYHVKKVSYDDKGEKDEENDLEVGQGAVPCNFSKLRDTVVANFNALKELASSHPSADDIPAFRYIRAAESMGFSQNRQELGKMRIERDKISRFVHNAMYKLDKPFPEELDEGYPEMMRLIELDAQIFFYAMVKMPLGPDLTRCFMFDQSCGNFENICGYAMYQLLATDVLDSMSDCKPEIQRLLHQFKSHYFALLVQHMQMFSLHLLPMEVERRLKCFQSSA